jgi:hypothetical protein
MHASQALGIVAGIFLIAGYIPYIYEVFKKQTIPNRASWFIWALSTTILLFGVKATGTHEAIWVPVADAVGCLAIFILAIWRGVGGWSITDRISLLVCFASLGVWFFTGNALLALLMNLCIYISGYVPTIKKALLDPRHESRNAWSLFFIGVVLNLVTVIIGTDRGFAVWLYPIVLIAVVGVLLVLLLRKPKAYQRSI